MTEIKVDDHLLVIYDFGLLPYALGDVLTFNIQSAVKCLNARKKNIRLLICCDQNYCANFDQRKFINKKNYEYFYDQLSPAFQAQAVSTEVLKFDNREKFVKYLQTQINDDAINNEVIGDYLLHLKYIKNDYFFMILRYLYKVSHIKKYLDKFKKNVINFQNLVKWDKEKFNASIINKYYIKNIFSHKRLNDYYLLCNSIPQIKIRESYINELTNFLHTNFSNKKIIAVHARQRKNENFLDSNAALFRDADELIWLNFFKKVSTDYPEILFILLGRLEEKSTFFLNLKNTLSLRKYGFNLGHDLAAIELSNGFMGSSSGFAAYANFTKIPYVVTNVKENSCAGYEINYGEPKLPFATSNQKLIYGKETTSDLIISLNSILGNHAQ